MSFVNYTTARFRALVTFDCFILMTMVSRNLLRGAWTRIYNFTTYKARALRSSTGQSHSYRRFENPVVDSSPCSFLLPPYPRNSGSLATSFKHWPIERTAKQLYTYFIEPDIVFRIAIVHAIDLKTPIDNVNVTTALEKYCPDSMGIQMTNKNRKMFKRLQTLNDL